MRVHIEATQMSLEQTSAIGLAVDTPSLDYGQSADFATHYAWFGCLLRDGGWKTSLILISCQRMVQP